MSEQPGLDICGEMAAMLKRLQSMETSMGTFQGAAFSATGQGRAVFANGTLQFGSMKQMYDASQVLPSLAAGRCPDCGGTEFLQGPKGGCITNIECRNCGKRFNVMLPWFAERI